MAGQHHWAGAGGPIDRQEQRPEGSGRVTGKAGKKRRGPQRRRRKIGAENKQKAESRCSQEHKMNPQAFL